jgi:hypothetical protein
MNPSKTNNPIAPKPSNVFRAQLVLSAEDSTDAGFISAVPKLTISSFPE